MPKGVFNADRQLDALAHCIIGSDLKKVARKMGVSTPGVYHLAKAAVRRLQKAQSQREQRESSARHASESILAGAKEPG